MANETVLVLDFGGQYNQLIARRVREAGVYSVVKSYKTPVEEIRTAGYKGIIFTGGPNSVYADDSPRCPAEILTLGVPVLGICYGAQLMAWAVGRKGGERRTGIRLDRRDGGALQPAVQGDAEGTDLLDEPYGLYCVAAGGFSHCWLYAVLPLRGDGKRRKKAVCGAVSSGSDAHRQRRADAA